MCVIPQLYVYFTHRLTQRHAHRIVASQILKHPFITDDPTLQNPWPSKAPVVSGTPQLENSERITGVCGPSVDPPWAIARDHNADNRSRLLSRFAARFNHRQVVLGDISNKDFRKPSLSNCSLPFRRAVSDPISLKTPYCIADKKSTNSDSTLKSDASLTKQKSVSLNGVLSPTHDIVLPFQNSMPPDVKTQLAMKPPKSNKNMTPPVSQIRYYRGLFFFIDLAAPS